MGFQLVVVLTRAFERLPEASRLLHGAALLCVALTTVLLIAPAALHRIVWAGEDSEALMRIGGRLTMMALVPLALGMAGDAYVVFARITASPGFGVAVSVMVLLALFALWFAWPMVLRRGRSGSARSDATE
jgi:hypothetical protein